MKHEDAQVPPADAGRLDQRLGRPVPERAKPLSYRQSYLMQQAPVDWGGLPTSVGCTNATLEALERRGLVETRVRREPSPHVPGAMRTVWEWRKTPNVRGNAHLTAAQEVEDGTK